MSSRVKVLLTALAILVAGRYYSTLRRLLLGLVSRKVLAKKIPWLRETHGGLVAAHVFQQHGVKTVFTLTGGHIAPILTGCEELGIRVVDVRHEASAAFAADAASRVSGTVGVCVVTAGPGLTNTITAVKNAQMAQSPLLLIGGATTDVLKGRGSLQDIDQFALLGPHVKWMAHVSRVADIAPMLEEAFYRAKEGVPGPVFVEIPVDALYPREGIVQQYEKEKPKGPGLFNSFARWYLDRHVRYLFSDTKVIEFHAPVTPPLAIAHGWQVAQAVKMLTTASKPVIIIGAQAAMLPELTKGLISAIEVIGAPVWLSSNARGILGTSHPLVFRHRRGECVKQADVVLLAGVVLDFRLGYGLSIRGSTKIISINLDKADLYKNRTPTLPILADPSKALAQIGEMMKSSSSKADSSNAPASRYSSWIADIRAGEDKRDQEIAEMAEQKGELINPVALCREIEKAMDPDAQVICDGGDFVATFAYNCRPRGPRKWLDPGPFGTLSVGGGMALGAGCSNKSETWLIWGDGACGFSVAEMDTMVRHKIPVICIVGNDAAWMQIVRDQARLLGRTTAGMLAYSDYHVVAQGFGAHGIVVKSIDEVPAALKEAKTIAAQGKPVLVNCLLGRSAFREGSMSM